MACNTPRIGYFDRSRQCPGSPTPMRNGQRVSGKNAIRIRIVQAIRIIFPAPRTPCSGSSRSRLRTRPSRRWHRRRRARERPQASTVNGRPNRTGVRTGSASSSSAGLRNVSSGGSRARSRSSPRRSSNQETSEEQRHRSGILAVVARLAVAAGSAAAGAQSSVDLLLLQGLVTLLAREASTDSVRAGWQSSLLLLALCCASASCATTSPSAEFCTTSPSAWFGSHTLFLVFLRASGKTGRTLGCARLRASGVVRLPNVQVHDDNASSQHTPLAVLQVLEQAARPNSA